MRLASALTVLLLAAVGGVGLLWWRGLERLREPPAKTLSPEAAAKVSHAIQMYLQEWDPGTQVESPFGQREFEQHVWLADVERRAAMADDLCQRLLHEGMSKTDVRALLGDPQNSEYQEEQGNIDAYCLGAVEQFVMDAYFLEIHYDESQRVTSTNITQY